VESTGDGARQMPLSSARIGRMLPRLGAALADFLLLALVGAILGMLIGQRVAPAGTPARLFGLLVAVPYFALFASTHGGGQTFGQTLLGLRVVDAQGASLSLARSTVRALVLAAPWFFNNLHFSSVSAGALLASWVASVLLMGVNPASLATYLLGRKARQGLHDFLTSSYVVEADDAGRPVAARTPRPLAVGALGWIGLVAIFFTVQLREGFAGLAARSSDLLGEQLAAVPHLSCVLVNTVHQTRILGNVHPADTVVRIAVWYDGPEADLAKAKHDVVSAVLWHYPGLPSASLLSLTIIRGWDVGLASWTESETEVHPPDAWRALD
jgi:uncharacterized RDD family membrane protein YckC